MDIFISQINKCFKEYINYNKINQILANNKYEHKIRNNLIPLKNVFEYYFKYACINNTKLNIISDINFNNDTTYNRTSYYRKENNIPIEWYNELQNKINDICYCYINNNNVNINKYKIIAIDGTNTNNIKQKVELNMGYYNVSNKCVIDLTHEGNKNRNKEVLCTSNYIKSNINKFNNCILVCDRFYFTYNFLTFLNKNNIKFIIRCRGECKKFNNDYNFKKNENNIKELKNYCKVISFEEKFIKEVFNRKTKKLNGSQYTIECKNDCKIITNINDMTNEDILNNYRSRWDIETFFKIIKNNFKIQHTKEKNENNKTKIYAITNIIMNIKSVIEKNYIDKNNIKNKTILKKNKKNVNVIIKINQSNLINGIMNKLLKKIINSNLTYDNITLIQNNYCFIVQNEEGRHFIRHSNKPFSKWNCKSYSINSQENKIISAIENNTTDKLHKNLKTKCKNIKILTKKVLE